MNDANNVFHWVPCSVVFLSTAHGGQRDIMTATTMCISEKEPLMIISVSKGHLSEQLINDSGEFTVVIAGADQKKLAMQLGSTKGEAVDKFEKFSIQTVSGPSGNAPVPEGSSAWMSCTVEGKYDIEGYRVFIGRVKEQGDMNVPPLVWQKNKFFGLQPL